MAFAKSAWKVLAPNMHVVHPSLAFPYSLLSEGFPDTFPVYRLQHHPRHPILFPSTA